MFTKTKGDGTDTPITPAQAAVRSASSKPASKVGASIICADMTITGSIASDGAIQIDGKVDGDITASDMVIGSTGEIVGEIKADTLRVKGKIRGSIRAKKVELETGASVIGDIIHSALVIQPDASFEGQVKREDNPLADKTPQAATTTPASASTATGSASASSSTSNPFSSTSGTA
ncbi:polymer-forming cytoskeletal protein [Hyphomonas sp. FCG-A18]|jgi:cytoskeletal protein CcmA (bactofilin family)|uniref:bactofilin family protein n=1 Tax=Hyphomonas sp. FCG-A18 TaxID=3080019 RepID=UPI002B2BB34C|nr:polymer-forming cytoskeletal protein [Hyphomonas sp. FCG-A18]